MPSPAPLDRATAERVSVDLIRLVKLIKAVRQHAPRIHPAVDTAAYPLLFNLAGQGELRVSALAECTHSDISTTSRQVSTLVGHGLLEKVTDPEDGRAQVVRLSARGQELLGRIKTERAAWFQQLLDGWTADDATAFADHLERFIGALERFRALPTTSSTTPES